MLVRVVMCSPSGADIPMWVQAQVFISSLDGGFSVVECNIHCWYSHPQWQCLAGFGYSTLVKHSDKIVAVQLDLLLF